MKLSIVTSLYNSAPFLDEFIARIKAAAEQITDDFEIVCVIDGSPDNSLEKAMAYYLAGEPVHIVDLSRNHGQHIALMAGLERTRGDYVFLIDSDLEEDPQLLVRFWQMMQEQPQYDVVLGVQRTREGSFAAKYIDGWFYSLFNALSSVPIRRNAMTVRLMSRRYVNHLVQHGECDVFMAGLLELVGYAQLPVLIEKGRRIGRSTYSLSRKIALAVSAITSFSAKPLEIIFFGGTLISFLSFLGVAWLIYAKLVLKHGILGWTSVIVSIWLLGGLMLSAIGVIGIYLARVFQQVKQRPRVLVRQEFRTVARRQVSASGDAAATEL